MSTLHPQADRIRHTTETALTLVTRLNSLDSLPRIYLAEMIVVRLFSLLEVIFEDSACRMICGTNYCDGSTPQLLRHRPTRSFKRARVAMLEYERSSNSRIQLRWGRASDIKKNLENLFPADEHFINTITIYGSFISDLRKVRNHIAHGNARTRKRFDEVVRRHYGAKVNSITPGKMMLSSRFTPLLLEQFCKETRIILLEVIKG